MNTPVHVAFGKGVVEIDADPLLADWTVIRPKAELGLADPQAAFVAACRHPIGAMQLREIIKPDDKVVVVTADGTRPVPNHLLIPWLLAELPIPPAQVTVLIGTGSHRPNTDAEIESMFGRAVARQITILNHDAFEPTGNCEVGRLRDGTPVRIDRRYVEADKRIVLGFIEPHFLAGFSGGAKAVVPGLADINLIHRIHNFDLIGNSGCTWGRIDGNPMRDLIEDAVHLCPPEFMVNVTLNSSKEITAVFAGDYVMAHREGCRFSATAAMQEVPHSFPIVVTSNSGFPLDQNLYQTVKGIAAAIRIVEEGGTIIVCSECVDGIPAHGRFAELMQKATTPLGVLSWIKAQPTVISDQWQAQLLSQYLLKTDILLHTRMDRASAAACKIRVIDDVNAELRQIIRIHGGHPRIAILPDGPITIPYIHQGAPRWPQLF